MNVCESFGNTWLIVVCVSLWVISVVMNSFPWHWCTVHSMDDELKRVVTKRHNERRKALAYSNEDGIVVATIRALLRWSRYYWPFERLMDCVLSFSSDTRIEPDIRYRKGVEMMWFLWTLVLATVYAVCVASEPGVVALALLAGLCAFRVVDISATAVMLHFLQKYETKARAHALLLTILGYVQVAICFGVLYLVAAHFFDDCFAIELREYPMKAFYFSALTISTLGMQNTGPLHEFGQALQVTEVGVGLLLVVVAIQRVITATS
jgi:hypothetical protein